MTSNHLSYTTVPDLSFVLPVKIILQNSRVNILSEHPKQAYNRFLENRFLWQAQ